MSCESMQRIIVDVRGGDYAPDEIVKGAVEASDSLPDTHFTLVGIPSASRRF